MRLENVDDVYALSPMQEGMLFHTVSEDGGGGVFVTQVECELSGDLDVGAFRRSWDRLVARHGCLRTAYLWDGVDEPLQVVRRRVEVPWSESDWRGRDEETRRAELEELLRDDRARGFDLESAPLLRMYLIRMTAGEWRWIWSFHHLVADGWSTRSLLRELERVYEGECRGVRADLDPPFAYRDYIAWHAGTDLAAAEAFWREELRGFAEPTRLAAIGPPAARSSAGFRQATVRLDAETTAALRALAVSQRVTSSTVVAGAWAVLLARHAGEEEEVVFGVTTSGRPPELGGIEDAVGLFINTLPLRVTVDPAARTSEWLRELQRRQVELRKWEASPLHAIQRWSEIAAGEALFETIVVFESHPSTAGEGSSLVAEGPMFREQSNYPLALLAIPGDRLELLLVYDSARVRTGFAELLLRHLEAVLESFVASPDGALGDLRIGSPEELAKVTVEWNRTASSPPSEVSAYGLFEETARGMGSAPALLAGERSVGYDELLERVERLEAALRSLGVGPEVVVGIFVERSVEMVIGMLAVLAAGGAYLPLDPAYPAEYRDAMVREAGARLVLTRRGLLDLLSDDDMRLLDLEDPGSWPVAGSPPEPARAALGADLAYVMYTSGSTGRPKGVAVTHRNLVSSTRARSDFYRDGVGRFLLLSSFAFDSSVAGIYWTLCSGGALVLPADGEERDLEAVARLIRRHRVTHTLCLPALYELLLEEAAGDLESLRIAIVAGEACPPSLAARHHATLPGARLFNEYGPTEATVWTSVHEVVAADAAGTVPIGRPIANARVYVLDSRRLPVPPGAPGELYLGGDGVARGYLGRERLTAQRFVTVDIEGVGEERLYRTGDLAHWREDGELVFLGRRDGQVKVRGHRIETAGVEAALRGHPAVAEAAVAVSSARGAARLVAWAVAEGADGGRRELEEAPLREWLGGRLPAFMVPDRIVSLALMPRTPNGKVDYRALGPPPGREREPRTAALGAVERDVAAAWSELLDLDEVGAGDNFFELGGDSILAIQLVSRLRQAGYAVEPRDVGLHPTVAELAAVASSSAPVDGGEERPVVGEVPLLPIQAWFFERDLAVPEHWNLSRMFEVPEDFDPALFAAALQHCMAHHDMLRATFRRGDDGRWCQIVAAPDAMAARVDTVEPVAMGEPESDARRARRDAAAQSDLDLRRGPLLRAAWAPGGGGSPRRLLLVAHHLVMDAASWAPVLADLTASYLRLRAGEPVELPARTASYERWARRLAATDAGAELDYWLSRPAAGIALPVDREPERPPTEADAVTERVRLDRERTRSLLGPAAEAYGTRVDELLIAAVARVVSHWTGEGTVQLGVERHGRPDDLDVSRTVGWFTAAFPVALSVDPGMEPGASIRAVKEQLRRVPGNGVGYGVLRYLGDDEVARRLAGTPQPQILVNYLSRLEPSSPGDLLRPVEGADATSRDGRNARSHLLEINAAVRDGALVADWIFCRTVHERATIAALSHRFVDELSALIDHCLEDGAGSLTPSDFPAAELEAEDLERLLKQFERP